MYFHLGLVELANLRFGICRERREDSERGQGRLRANSGKGGEGWPIVGWLKWMS